MEYILTVINTLEALKNFLKFNGQYMELVIHLCNFDDEIALTPEIQELVTDTINALDVPLIDSCVQYVKQEEDLKWDDEYFMTDRELLNLLGYILKTVSISENDKYLLFKYNECIWNTGWHLYALQSRGKVIDKNSLQIVSYGFDKFFNYGEGAHSSVELIERKMSEAKKISLTNKLDGSTIIISNYNGDIVITTNGAFDNFQTEAAKEILNKKYRYFLDNIPCGYTFVFELIHPENHIVVNYGNKKDLFLLAVRENSLLEKGLLMFERVQKIAEEYNLSLVQREEFYSISDLLKKAHTMKNANKEGWVVRIEDSGHVDYMFKVKLEEYFLMHRAKSRVSIKNVYNLILENSIDKFLEMLDAETKEDALSVIEEIEIIWEKISERVRKQAHEIISSLELDTNNLTKSDMISIVGETGKDKLFGPLVIDFIKTGQVPLRTIRYSRFKEMSRFLES